MGYEISKQKQKMCHVINDIILIIIIIIIQIPLCCSNRWGGFNTHIRVRVD